MSQNQNRRDATWTGGPAVAEIGETGMLDRLVILAQAQPAGWSVGGFGDDAAVWLPPAGPAQLVFSIDSLAEGADFRRAWQSPYEVGRKAWGMAASDLAAMGARAVLGMAAATFPADLSQAALEAVQLGLVEAASECGPTIAGGDLGRGGHGLQLTVAVVGAVESGHAVPLGAGVAGDSLYVTGELGAAAGALRLLRQGETNPPGDWRRQLVRPVPRLEAGVWLRDLGVHAMTDLSDGLLQDASRLARASGLRAELWGDRVPLAIGLAETFGDDALGLAASGGEDYELLAAASTATLAGPGPAGLGLSVVGRLTPGEGVALLAHEGGPGLALPEQLGFRHF